MATFRTAFVIAAVGAVSAVSFIAGRWSATSASVQPSPEFARASSPREANPAKAELPKSVNAAQGPTLSFQEQMVRPAMSLAAEEQRQRLIEQWAAREPAQALEFARKELRGDRRAHAVASILQIWGGSDPAAAWKWVQQNEPTATHHFDTLLETFGRHSPTLAAQYAADYARAHPEAAAEVHLAALLGITHNGNFDEARRVIEFNPALDPETRGTLNNFIAGQWARYEPNKAAEWVMTLPSGPLRDQALIGLGESWAGIDPKGAADFAVKLPAGTSRQQALHQSMMHWAMSDPGSASQWILSQAPHSDFDQAMAAVATNPELAQRNARLAMEWAQSVSGEPLRSNTLNEAFVNWHARDSAAALAYLENASALTPEQRTQLRARVTSNPDP